MTYLTIDTLPDLSATAMNAAVPLDFAPYKSDTPGISWDERAHFEYYGLGLAPTNAFSFIGVANAVYDLFSYSPLEPSPIKVYDMAGNAVASDDRFSNRPDDFRGQDYLHKFVAPYSGKYYVAAGWNFSPSSSNGSITVYADIDSVRAAPTSVTGTDADDNLGNASDGNDYVDGGSGIDTLYYLNPLSQYSFVRTGTATTITSKFGGEGSDVVRNVEWLSFYDYDQKLNSQLDLRYVDLTESLYVGYFGRAADQGGLKAFQAQLAALNAPSTVKELTALYATDAAIRHLVDSFGASSESQALYGGDTKGFVTAIFTNLLNRAPQQSGLDFWTNAIDSGSLTRASASLSIMAGAQANDTAQGRVDAKLLGVKLDVATNFTFAMDTEQLAAAYDGAGPAAAVRTMLRSLNANTDVADFQSTVQQVLGKMAHLPGVQAPLPEAAHDDPAPILLTGIDTSHDGAALVA